MTDTRPTTLETLHALVDLRAIARARGMTVRMTPPRGEHRAHYDLDVSVTGAGGLVAVGGYLARGESGADLMRCMIRALCRISVESDAP